MRWLLRTLSLSALMAGTAVLLFVLGTVVSESVIRHYWRGDDDWIWLLLPLGGFGGIVLGVRYRDQRWLHIASTVIGLALISALVAMLQVAQSPAIDLAEGIGRKIAAYLVHVALATTIVCFCVAGLVSAFLDVLARVRRGNGSCFGDSSAKGR